MAKPITNNDKGIVESEAAEFCEKLLLTSALPRELSLTANKTVFQVTQVTLSDGAVPPIDILVRSNPVGGWQSVLTANVEAKREQFSVKLGDYLDYVSAGVRLVDRLGLLTKQLASIRTGLKATLSDQRMAYDYNCKELKKYQDRQLGNQQSNGILQNIFQGAVNYVKMTGYFNEREVVAFKIDCIEAAIALLSDLIDMLQRAQTNIAETRSQIAQVEQTLQEEIEAHSQRLIWQSRLFRVGFDLRSIARQIAKQETAQAGHTMGQLIGQAQDYDALLEGIRAQADKFARRRQNGLTFDGVLARQVEVEVAANPGLREQFAEIAGNEFEEFAQSVADASGQGFVPKDPTTMRQVHTTYIQLTPDGEPLVAATEGNGDLRSAPALTPGQFGILQINSNIKPEQLAVVQEALQDAAKAHTEENQYLLVEMVNDLPATNPAKPAIEVRITPSENAAEIETTMARATSNGHFQDGATPY